MSNGEAIIDSGPAHREPPMPPGSATSATTSSPPVPVELEVVIGRMVERAQRDADDVLAQAHKRAAEVVAAAQREASRLLREAQAEVERRGAAAQVAADVRPGTPGDGEELDTEMICALLQYLDDAGGIHQRITATVRAAVDALLSEAGPQGSS